MTREYIQRSILTGGIAVALLVLSGCAKPVAQTPSDDAGSATSEDASVNENSDTGTLPGEGTLVDSYRALLGNGKQLSCVFSTDRLDGTSLETKTFLDGEKRYKSMVSDPKLGTITTLFDGNAVYSWTEGAKTGMKMDISCLDDVKKTAGKNAPNDTYASNDDMLDTAPDISCAESSEATDFSVPSTISFTDQCAMMRDAQKMMESVKNASPDSAVNIPVIPQ